MKNALNALPGVRQIDVKLGSATVTVEQGKVSADQIVKAIEDEGFGCKPAASAPGG